MNARIEKTVTSGTFSLDGGTWDVDNNVWVVGDDEECVVIDAPHDAAAIAALVGGRRVVGILLTHAHDDHIDALGALQELVDAPAYLHPEDLVLWERVYPGTRPVREVADGDVITVAGIEIHALHTPGHSPGAVCYYAPALGALFSGDTLFSGGPGATGRSYSDFPTIVESIRTTLLTLPPTTAVHTGHGDSTTIGNEAPHVQEWIDRGH
ncbi:MBL fold metallo-hydrolase [Georgenia faecalis]|uniref:MBL fold metallo-hydrolase n=1 Tax=Georgenia faecalis TaxID=2483799 RepID=A0ABV9D4S0_9MICO|nr:MBL fold metallo-hydrolase [Georgenia faecalis]